MVLRQVEALLPLGFYSQGDMLKQPALVCTEEGLGLGGSWSDFAGVSGLELGAQAQPPREWHLGLLGLS